MNEKIEQKLTKDNITPTSMRVLVLKELLESSTAVGIKELEKRFDKVDKVTLYRTLKTFEEKKIIHTIQDGTNELKYAVCQEGCECAPHEQHVHFHCDKCDETYCLTKTLIPPTKIPIGYTAKSVTMVYQGTCSNCQ